MTVAPPIPDVDVDELRGEIQKEYASVAENPDKGFHFHTGRKLAGILGYEESLLEGIPEAAIESFAGTGNPFSLGELALGEKVVDLGSGAGIDSLVAGKLVGPTGQVIGIDMTPEMLNKAKQAAIEAGMSHVEFRQGFIESLPVEDGWADIIISNGVVNLAPDKVGLFREMNRALRPGGRLQIGDIMVQKAVPDGAKQNIDLWKGWIAGALLEAELEAVVEAAGFQDFEITWRDEVFAGAPQQSSAASFGTLGINFRANKPT